MQAPPLLRTKFSLSSGLDPSNSERCIGCDMTTPHPHLVRLGLIATLFVQQGCESGGCTLPYKFQSNGSLERCMNHFKGKCLNGKNLQKSRAGPEAKKLLSKKKLHRSSQEDVHVPPPFYNGLLHGTFSGVVSWMRTINFTDLESETTQCPISTFSFGET
ncbi:uncharacterized protein [Lolium perenne]|uniref:uncharacterized protein isoform X2 n=1 Tax=Lolium perenne TaxID=4522 RepID=UPI0021F66C0D|nr:uncharacterized protein LOC127334404 isoform X2 [Lolium perenne]